MMIYFCICRFNVTKNLMCKNKKIVLLYLDFYGDNIQSYIEIIDLLDAEDKIVASC